MVRRVLVAVVAIPAALLIVRVGGWPMVAVLAALAALGALELFRLVEAQGAEPFRFLGVTAAAAMPALTYAVVQRQGASAASLGGGLALWTIVVMGAGVFARSPDRHPVEAITTTFFAPVYTGLLLASVVVLRHAVAERTPWSATGLVFLPLVTVWVCDSMAMAGGAVFGGPKFAPIVSPKKTWAGTITGSVSGAVVAPLFGWLILARSGVRVEPLHLAVFGLVVATVGQVGDLAESLFKRQAGVKDSGGLFPGHGGVLDRLDSLYWALPVAAALLAAFGVL
jgi:phosphatidate cytidylyltransferase